MPSINVDLNTVLARSQAEFNKAKDEGDQIVARFTAENRDMTKEETDALTDAQARMADADKRIKATRSWFEKAAANVNPDNAPAGDGNRYVPGLPQTTAGTGAPTTSTPTSPTASPASTGTASTTHRKRGGPNTGTSGGTPPIARGPAPMSFPAEEIKPVRVDLLK
jgi:ABC-type transporter Mla subunit MlaD